MLTETATKPQRIHLLTEPTWTAPPNTVFVGRPTLYGNPYDSGDPQKALDAYLIHIRPGPTNVPLGPDLWIAPDAHKDAMLYDYPGFLRTQAVRALRGKNLACTCPPEAPCHANALLELVNSKIL